MDYDTAVAQHGGWISIIRCVELVVVNQPGAVAPDPEPYLVLTITIRLITINRRQHKLVAAAAIDRAGTCVLCLIPGNHQPLITRALEIQTAGIELKPGTTGRHGCSALVSGDKTEARLPA